MAPILQGRRDFVKAMLAAGGAASGLLPSIARALDIAPAKRTGTIQDVAHVVILTQENRSFDHYFGALPGVRGFGDRFAIPASPLPGAERRSVFVQPNEAEGQSPALIAPFRLDTQRDFRLIRPLGTPHSFTDSQAAWDNGRMGEWPRHKKNHAMAHFTRADIPFQYALADAFTLCDAYHCALHLSTNPNRLYIWTGTHDPLGRGHGPAINNDYDSFADPQKHGGYTWTTYPERLMDAGISFQIYQDMADNFTDNPLVGFRRYREAKVAQSPELRELARRTIETRDLDLLKADVTAGRLPQVSWIVAPAAFSEHPSASTPLQGAEYTSRVLDALTADPEVWARTVLLVNFDENDGLFDHVPPPSPPARAPEDPTRTIGATTIPADDEYHVRTSHADDARYRNRPYGLGPRVPLYAVSPWSTGGYVASEVFDHTSIIRFLEARFGVHEPNISAWRRAVCGDLTSCFDFAAPDNRSFVARLPQTRELSERASKLEEIAPPLPATLTAPIQEYGLRRRRAVPYRLDAYLCPPQGDTGLEIRMTNRSADRAAVFHLYRMDALDRAPERYTVGARATLVAPLASGPSAAYDVFLLGPAGLHRRFTGRAGSLEARIDLADGKATLVLQNHGLLEQTWTVGDLAYGRANRHGVLPGRARTRVTLDLEPSHGWYDLLIEQGTNRQRLAGHIENGSPSYSDPAAHGAAPLQVVAK
jgi:phospholipase C